MNNQSVKEVFAPAKLNLSLFVTGMRSDGYHTMVSVFQKIALFDKIKFSTHNKTLNITCLPDGPDGEHNIVYRVFMYLSRFLNQRPQYSIVIHKSIPMSTGLGGGSSDAGTILKMIADEFQIENLEMSEIALRIGADVPFFVSKYTTAIGTGIGEILEPFSEVPPYEVLISIPSIRISTRWAYREIERLNQYSDKQKAILKSYSLISALRNMDKKSISKFAKNDFEKVIYNTYPDLYDLKKRLQALGGIVTLLTGTGSGVYSIFFPGEAPNITEIDGIPVIKSRFLTTKDNIDP